MMGTKAIVLLAIYCFTLFCDGHGLSAHGPLTKEEDSELEMRLKTINKPPVRTLKAFNGEIIDCVDIYKQPAFDHPLLKNHKIERLPRRFPGGVKRERIAQATTLDPPYMLGECPKGTVPIRRTTKEDLIRQHLYAKSQAPKYNSSLAIPPITHFAFLSIEASKQGPLLGAEGYINVYNPPVEPGSFSAGQIFVTDGPMEGIASNIEAGWMVNPSLYGDSFTHFFIRWTGGGNKGTGCYDVACPGFVQVHPKISVGSVLPNTATTGGAVSEIVVQIYRDHAGTWWLCFGDDREVIGYWPKDLFDYFGNGASRISFGGQVGHTSGGPSPPMGNGRFPDHQLIHSDYVRQIRYMNSELRLTYPNPDALATHVDVPLCYNATNEGNLGGDTGFATTFGGPGGSCG